MVVLAHIEKEVKFKGYKGVWVRFDAFKKMKYIFFITLVKSLEKSSECFSLKNTHRTL